jgi:hypothetical protein
MALVDYKGFRVTCTAKMAISFETNTVLNLKENVFDISALEKLSEACTLLNLKEHTICTTSNGKLTKLVSRAPSSATIHYVKKLDHYYALNLKQLFPVDHSKKGKPLAVNKRLRPEFVQQYRHALSADAMSTNSYSTNEDDVEVLYASRHLRENHIPCFVRKLDSLEILPYDAHGMSRALHAHGINIRYLGLVAQHTKLPCVKELCLVEMLARSCKVVLSRKIREAVQNFRRIGATKVENELIRIAVEFFNQVLSSKEKVPIIFYVGHIPQY